MNLTDPLSARKALTTLLRNPADWPQEFIFCWDRGFPSTFGGYTYGCAKALAEYTGIVRNAIQADKDLGLTHREYTEIFMHDRREPSAIADRLEAITS